MRQCLGTLLAAVVGMVSVGATRAEDADKARAIIDKAIKALGGAKKLGKYKAATWKEEGTYYGMGEGLPYKGKYASQGPDQFRMEIEGVFTIVLNGDKGWTKMGNETKAMTKEQLAQQKTEHRAGYISTLLPLQDKAFKLEALDETTVDKKLAVGVKVTHKAYPEVKLYFDKKTGLLAKVAYRGKAPEQKFKEVDQELYFHDYKAVDGRQVPHKIVMKRDGKPFVKAKIEDWEAKEKLDDKVFAEP
jgi:hypothetical protein